MANWRKEGSFLWLGWKMGHGMQLDHDGHGDDGKSEAQAVAGGTAWHFSCNPRPGKSRLWDTVFTGDGTGFDFGLARNGADFRQNYDPMKSVQIIAPPTTKKEEKKKKAKKRAPKAWRRRQSAGAMECDVDLDGTLPASPCFACILSCSWTPKPKIALMFPKSTDDDGLENACDGPSGILTLARRV
uniref:Uncharacterized protein n=1 Tax=Panagrellus redivivus TaxID=6233 RepID=A0A7E4WD08_PANRE